jgi:RNA-binding protein
VENRLEYHYQKIRRDKVLSKMSVREKRDVKRTLAQGNPTVCVGKSGAAQELLKEIEKQLKKEEMVKIRILKSVLAHDEEAKQMASRIAEQTEATLVEVRGHTFMLYKPDKK